MTTRTSFFETAPTRATMPLGRYYFSALDGSEQRCAWLGERRIWRIHPPEYLFGMEWMKVIFENKTSVTVVSSTEVRLGPCFSDAELEHTTEVPDDPE